MSDIEAIDGEAIDGKYALMRSSDGRELVGLTHHWPHNFQPEPDLSELHTRRIFQWLANGKTMSRYCCFGVNYDANQWVKNMAEPYLKKLWENGSVFWDGWRVQWIPSKLFEAKHVAYGYGFVVDESWGYFQKRFVDALEQWQIDCPDVIEWGKAERVDFKFADLERASEYCLAECVALKELMQRVRDCSEDVGLKPRSWIGPGQLASELMRQQGVKAYHRHDKSVPGYRHAHEPVRCAYFGGRVEALAQGRFDEVWTYDLSSAYPHAMLSLPNLSEAYIEPRAEYDPHAVHAIWFCRWKTDGTLPPFPVRVSKQIWYPAAGEGFYHAAEVRAALRLFGSDIEVQGGFVLNSVPGVPFAWVPDIYRERVRRLARGDMSGQMLKLALNSCYGKLAQSKSSRSVSGAKGFIKESTPKWRQFWWAGEITAITRARLLEFIREAQDVPLTIATDGLVFDRRVRASITEGKLGGWEETRYTDFTLIGPGIYTAVHENKRITRSRGFFAKEVDWNLLEKAILRDGQNASYKYTSRRFIGLGAALARKDMGLWRQWVENPDCHIHGRIERRDERDGLLVPAQGPMVSEPYRIDHEREADEFMDQITSRNQVFA